MDQSVKYENDCESGNMSVPENAHQSAIKIEGSAAAQAPNASNVAYLPQQSMAAMQHLLSPLQFLQAPSGSTGTAGASLSWMMHPQYQMMMLPGSGMPQPLFLPSGGSGAGVFTMSDGQVFVTPLADAAANGSDGAMPAHSSQYHTGGGQLVQSAGGEATEVRGSGVQHGQTLPSPARHSVADGMKPPKKPLTPYMIFSKQIWPRVKAEHAHLSSVCEIGAIVGGLWRDLDPTQKQQYNELYAKDKERYDEELRNYLKTTGLMASDLTKMRPKRPATHHAHRSTPAQPRAPAPGQQQAWANGSAIPHAVGHPPPGAAGSVPTMYGNQDGSLPSNCTSGSSAPTYSDGTQSAGQLAANSRAWSWQQQQQQMSAPPPANSSMVHYQLPPSADTSDSGTASTATSEQSQFNGSPYAAVAGKPAPAWNHFGGNVSEPGQVEQLEAEVIRLRTALAEKTREAGQLQMELGAARRAIEDHQCTAAAESAGIATDGDGDADKKTVVAQLNE